DEARAARRQIGAVVFRNAIGHARDAEAVGGPLPAGARARDAHTQAVVDFGEGPGFVVAVVVAEAAEYAHVGRYLLLSIHHEAVLNAA
nr:hypothetical protein [Tanacetum cinerariifolium]